MLADIVCLREMQLFAHYYSVAASHLLALAMIDLLLIAKIDRNAIEDGGIEDGGHSERWWMGRPGSTLAGRLAHMRTRSDTDERAVDCPLPVLQSNDHQEINIRDYNPVPAISPPCRPRVPPPLPLPLRGGASACPPFDHPPPWTQAR